MPPTSVKALIREFKKYNYVDKVELLSIENKSQRSEKYDDSYLHKNKIEQTE
jgi:hypothetical protein